MKIKLFLSLALTALLSVSLVSCGQNQAQAEDRDAAELIGTFGDSGRLYVFFDHESGHVCHIATVHPQGVAMDCDSMVKP